MRTQGHFAHRLGPGLLSILALAPAALPAREACRGGIQDFAVCTQTLCGDLRGKARRACERSCRPAAIRTLAYVVTECRQTDASTLTGRQALQIRRGDCDPITVTATPSATLPDPLGDSCRRFIGEVRTGVSTEVGGPFQRLGVSQDGTGVVFEVTDDFSINADGLLPADQEGFFFVRSDGSGLRPLGPASRDPSWRLSPEPSFPGGFAASFDPRIPFSPSGKMIAFTDLGPGERGESTQVVTLDLATGTRTQITRLPPSSPPRPFSRPTGYLSFVDDDTIQFFSYADPGGLNPSGELRAFIVRTDGSGLRASPSPVALPRSRLVSSFALTGPAVNLLDLHLPGVPANTYRGFSDLDISEVFLLDGRHLLQLTNYRRWDTGAEFEGLKGRRVFFHASADPLGANPSGNCQLFSIDTLGRRLRQLTHFREGEVSSNGCFDGPPPGCNVGGVSQDPVTRSLVFYSSCDPFGTNPNGGQVFAMRPDGTGLRQLTRTRGLITGPDGAVTVEMSGPFAYSARSVGTFPK